MIKQVAVIALSFCIVLVSGVFTYAAWLVLPDTIPLLRDVGSLFVWVLGFAAGSAVFWKAIVRIFGGHHVPS